MSKLPVLFFIISFAVQAYAVQFDRTAVVPELTLASRNAYSSYADYRIKNRASYP